MPPGTQMCDDSETVMNMSLEKEGDEIGLAPTVTKCPIASSIISALSKVTHFAETLAMPEIGVECDPRPRILEGLTMQDRILNERDLSAVVGLVVYLRLLCVLFLHQSSTQNIDKDTFNGHMHLSKDAFITLGLAMDTTRIDEIEKLFEGDFPPPMIHELKEKLKRGKGDTVKFKQIDRIELALPILKRKLADVESGVKCVQTEFTPVMTSMEGLMSEMKAPKADIAMHAENSKGKTKWL